MPNLFGVIVSIIIIYEIRIFVTVVVLTQFLDSEFMLATDLHTYSF
jgi:hypothetical protein